MRSANFFFQFAGQSISWSTCIGVLIFTGLTAYDTQKIKNIYYVVGGDTREWRARRPSWARCALSRLPQYVPVPVALHGQPPLGEEQFRNEKPGGNAGLFCIRSVPHSCPNSAFKSFLSKILSTWASSWPRLRIAPPAATTLYWPCRLRSRAVSRFGTEVFPSCGGKWRTPRRRRGNPAHNRAIPPRKPCGRRE